MMREKAKAKITLHHDQPGCDSPFPPPRSNSDCTQKSPMPIHRLIHSTRSCANLAQRLLQVGCIILGSLLRLITSYNHIASIMDMMPVSTSQASCLSLIMLHAVTLASCDYTVRQRMAQGTAQRNLFSHRTATPPPPSPMHPSAPAPNTETPPPIKTRIFYVNKNLLTDVLSP